ncbi:MAG TPA: type II toxin-antitoxin system HicB family antitoxin [Spirochaetia bacterium]|nr:type II toxin-antitoxin system HicB family antitoxin [Spirochaetia bacterium]
MKYVYPAVFFPEGDGRYNVRVPDLPGCRTFGDNIADAIDMARDAVSMWLCDAEDKNEPIPKFSEPSALECPPEGYVSLIDADTTEYRRENDNRAVKKTLSIPSWLNAKAEKAGINFSQTLQDALKQRLG